MMNREEYRAREAEKFTSHMMSAYGTDDEQSNKNLGIMIRCFLNDTVYSGNWTIDNFAAYASDESNLQKFIDNGAVIL